jgi:hypothetical protein
MMGPVQTRGTTLVREARRRLLGPGSSAGMAEASMAKKPRRRERRMHRLCSNIVMKCAGVDDDGDGTITTCAGLVLDVQEVRLPAMIIGSWQILGTLL